MAVLSQGNYKPDPMTWMPSIHWAQYQNSAYYQGNERRLYDFEVMYVISGEMIVHFKDEPETIPYYPGDFLFLSARERHRIEIPTAAGAQLLGIHFDFYDEFELTPEIHMVVDETHDVQEALFCRMPVNADGERLFARKYTSLSVEIVKGMELICEEFTTARADYELICRGAMLQMLASILRLQTVPQRTTSAAYLTALRELVDEISGSLHLTWPNSVMAERLNVSEDHFIRLFKEQFGVTPNQFVQHLRHQEAKRCLRETEMKIEAIGCRIGYDSLHQFSHAFKRWQSVSPREYRKLCSIL